MDKQWIIIKIIQNNRDIKNEMMKKQQVTRSWSGFFTQMGISGNILWRVGSSCSTKGLISGFLRRKHKRINVVLNIKNLNRFRRKRHEILNYITDLNIRWLDEDEEKITNHKSKCDPNPKTESPSNGADYTHLHSRIRSHNFVYDSNNYDSKLHNLIKKIDERYDLKAHNLVIVCGMTEFR